MMIKHLMFVLALSVAGCTKASTANETPNNTDNRGAAPRAKATVTLTSVTFADDCGGLAPQQAPAAPAVRAASSEQAPSDAPAKESIAARRRCQQTSMQLAINGSAETDVRIKSVEVFDERGKSLGVLTASKPTRWVDASATYEAWDEKIAAGQTARASYVLSQPGFVSHYDSHDRTYTVKVVASVGGVDQPLQTTVMIVAQPAPVPT
ncbi:MAG: hypothetical protein M4D80_10995 [Myxococcota bacterium]|nr:hypothetical protein [Deltaproteobacteria bacterium]MDQ3335684.1 hypothetical protein [Myxococcota bacterium]